MANRNARARVAHETVQICKSGYYTPPLGSTRRVRNDIGSAIKGTIHYPGTSFEREYDLRDEAVKASQFDTKYVLRNCTTLEAASELALADASAAERGVNGHIACLNFASAKNPGGGFLKGSQAQEESLARASALYECIHPHQAHYNEGRQCGSVVYTDSILFSPHVPVFRDDDDNLLEQPYNVSFITSAAVNRGAATRKRALSPGKVRSAMMSRFEKVLSVAVINGVDTLVLGAWGCGVFRNDPEMIVDVFVSHLIDNKQFSNAFDCVYLAVLDRRERGIFDAFAARFSRLAA